MIKFFLLSIALFLLIGCASKSCAEFVGQADNLLARWDNLQQVAAAKSLQQVIEDDQAIRQDIRALQPPDCAQPAHKAALAYFDQAIETEVAILEVYILEDYTSEAALTAMVLKIEPLREALDLELDKLRPN